MARRAPRRNVTKTRSLETLESRVVMSADPLLNLHSSLIEDAPVMTTHVASGYDPNADFWAGGGFVDDVLDDLGQRIEQTLYEANQQTGQDQVLAKYGFTGTGQTIAVIDTGIAYSHYALGGGVGANYKVVGGWDFTENDWNFYDDYGPKAAHGTHVAGIIAAEGDGIHSGVATGVDLVGLRVFDDAGNGYFHWVEQALQWVYNNRNSYANPITAVNLSLGTEWNSLSVPAWAMLEDEFAKLESVGIFISVSAGNSFANYNTKGLSYPAASSHVVPVMATDVNGQLSYFSQRASSAIAAPGRYITSTVPDYAANDADTIDDDWLSMSGTSMAAPYVAGASALIRQAMQFVGQTGIDQWDIYNHMMATADTFYDSATATNYKRLNLKAAIDALMPVDDFGSSQVDAYNMGTLNASSATPLANISGVISTLDDADCFKFVAGASGTVTVKLPQVTHELTAQWQVWGANNWTVNQAGECVFDVVAGQTYTFSIATSKGLGYYGLSVNLEASFAAIQWGAIGPQETRTGLSVNGETWYEITAGRTGYLTAEAIAPGSGVSVTVYNAQKVALTTAGARADIQATAGQTYYLRVTGSAANFNLRMTNALTVSGGVASLVGTAGNDTLTFTAGTSQHAATINGVSYSFVASTINLAGGGGVDNITMTGGSGNETAVLRDVSATLTSNQGWQASASGYRNVSVVGGAGVDSVTFHATAANDTLTSSPARTWQVSGSQELNAAGFENITARNNREGGTDQAYLHGHDGDDSFTGRLEYSRLVGGGRDVIVFGYERVDAYGGAGFDRAYHYDSAGDDVFTGRPEYSVMRGSGVTHVSHGFEQVDAYANLGGWDRAYMYDSVGKDQFASRPEYTHMTGTGFKNVAWAFERVDAYTFAGGDDIAYLYDSAGSDIFTGRADSTSMQGAGFYNVSWYAEKTYAFGGRDGSNDSAVLYGATSSDIFSSNAEGSWVRGANFYNYVTGFSQVTNHPSSAPSSKAFSTAAASVDAGEVPGQLPMSASAVNSSAKVPASSVATTPSASTIAATVAHDSVFGQAEEQDDEKQSLLRVGVQADASNSDRHEISVLERAILEVFEPSF